MPYVVRPPRRARQLGRVAMTTLLAGLALAAPAAAATKAATTTITSAPAVCVTPSFGQVFLPWKDSAFYTLSPGGHFEGNLGSWQLAGGARVAAVNESYYVHSKLDHSSLLLPAGASAVSAPMCIDRTYPTFRFFARNISAGKGNLNVEVVWQESGVRKTFKSSLDKSAGTTWTPVKSLKLPSGALSTGRLEPVTFRFSTDAAGGFQVDDLYVDPYMRR
jgi:hypothetical protein